MRPNTTIKLEDLTVEHCRQILDAYKELGLRVMDSSMNPGDIANSLKEELQIESSIEYRPDGRSQNKLDFGVSSAGDGQIYLYVEARPMDSPDCQALSEKFDRKIQELFMR